MAYAYDRLAESSKLTEIMTYWSTIMSSLLFLGFIGRM